MPVFFFGAACAVCGCKFYGPEALIKAFKCESLGRPPFKFSMGETVTHRAFDVKIIGRKYRRRGNLHVPTYDIETVRAHNPRVFMGGLGPIGNVDKGIDEKNLHSIN